MELNLSQVNDTAVVSIAGSVDALTAGQVASYFTDQIQAGQRRVVADLGRVDFLSSAGLRAIMSVTRALRSQGGDFRLAAPQPGVDRVLHLSGFTGFLQTYPTVGEAVDSFGGEADADGAAGDDHAAASYAG
jgi:anti-anti-sigma factor